MKQAIAISDLFLIIYYLLIRSEVIRVLLYSGCWRYIVGCRKQCLVQ